MILVGSPDQYSLGFHPNGAISASVDNDGRLLALLTANGTLHVCDVQSVHSVSSLCTFEISIESNLQHHNPLILWDEKRHDVIDETAHSTSKLFLICQRTSITLCKFTATMKKSQSWNWLSTQHSAAAHIYSSEIEKIIPISATEIFLTATAVRGMFLVSTRSIEEKNTDGWIHSYSWDGSLKHSTSISQISSKLFPSESLFATCIDSIYVCRCNILVLGLSNGSVISSRIEEDGSLTLAALISESQSAPRTSLDLSLLTPTFEEDICEQNSILIAIGSRFSVVSIYTADVNNHINSSTDSLTWSLVTEIRGATLSNSQTNDSIVQHRAVAALSWRPLPDSSLVASCPSMGPILTVLGNNMQLNTWKISIRCGSSSIISSILLPSIHNQSASLSHYIGWTTGGYSLFIVNSYISSDELDQSCLSADVELQDVHAASLPGKLLRKIVSPGPKSAVGVNAEAVAAYSAFSSDEKEIVEKPEENSSQKKIAHLTRVSFADPAGPTGVNGSWMVSADAVFSLSTSTSSSPSSTFDSTVITDRNSSSLSVHSTIFDDPIGKDDETSTMPQLQWERFNVSPDYIASYGPVRLSAVSPDGNWMAVASSTGLQVLSKIDSKWYSMSSIDEERSINVRAMSWLSSSILVVLHRENAKRTSSSKDYIYELQLYNPSKLSFESMLGAREVILPRGTLVQGLSVGCSESLSAAPGSSVVMSYWLSIAFRNLHRIEDHGTTSIAIYHMLFLPQRVTGGDATFSKPIAAIRPCSVTYSSELVPFSEQNAGDIVSLPKNTFAQNVSGSQKLSHDSFSQMKSLQYDSSSNSWISEVSDVSFSSLEYRGGVDPQLQGVFVLPHEITVASFLLLPKRTVLPLPGGTIFFEKLSSIPSKQGTLRFLMPLVALQTPGGDVLIMHPFKSGTATLHKLVLRSVTTESIASMQYISAASFGGSQSAAALIIPSGNRVHTFLPSIDAPYSVDHCGTLISTNFTVQSLLNGVERENLNLCGSLPAFGSCFVYADSSSKLPSVHNKIVDFADSHAPLPQGFSLIPSLPFLLHSCCIVSFFSQHEIASLQNDPLADAIHFVLALKSANIPLLISSLKMLVLLGVESQKRFNNESLFIVKQRKVLLESVKRRYDQLNASLPFRNVEMGDFSIDSSLSESIIATLNALSLAYSRHVSDLGVIKNADEPRENEIFLSQNCQSIVSPTLISALAVLFSVDLHLEVLSCAGRAMEEADLSILFTTSGLAFNEPRSLFVESLIRSSIAASGVNSKPKHNLLSLHYLRVAGAFMLIVQENEWKSSQCIQVESNKVEGMNTVVRNSMLDAALLLRCAGLSTPLAEKMAGLLKDTDLVSTAQISSEIASCSKDTAAEASLLQVIETTYDYCSRLEVALNASLPVVEAVPKGVVVSKAIDVDESSSGLSGILDYVGSLFGYSSPTKSNVKIPEQPSVTLANPSKTSDSILDSSNHLKKDLILEYVKQRLVPICVPISLKSRNRGISTERWSSEFSSLHLDLMRHQMKLRSRKIIADAKMIGSVNVYNELTAIDAAIENIDRTQLEWIQQFSSAETVVISRVSRNALAHLGDVVMSVAPTDVMDESIIDVRRVRFVTLDSLLQQNRKML
jgi:hypothetical protein